MTLRRLLPALAVLLLALLAGEWAARRWLQMPRTAWRDARFGWMQGPGTRLVQSGEGWGAFVADSTGWLDRPLPPPGQGVRAILLGDSFGQGLQVRDDERFTEVAERLLPGLHVLNAAAAGRSAWHHALLAPRVQQAYTPDLLLVQLDDGELTDVEDAAARAEAVAEFDSTRTAEPRTERGLARLAQSVFRRSALLSYLRTRVDKLTRQESQRLARKLSGRRPDTRDLVALPPTPRAEALLDSLVGEVQQVNARVVLVYIPNVDYFESPPSPTYPVRRAWYHEMARRRGLPLVDPTDEFIAAYRTTGEPLHGFSNSRPGEGHANARGHELLARELVRVLHARGWAGGGRR